MRKIKGVIRFLLTGELSPAQFWRLREKVLTSHGLLRRIYSFLYNRQLFFHNAAIPIEAEIKNEPVLPHGINGIFISKGAKIGKDCTIFHQVTIGSNTLKGSKRQGAPVIGDNVFIGCGAKIIGGVNVGNNSLIGAGCVVCDDVPENCSVVMPKFRVIQHEHERDTNFTCWDDFLSGQADL